MTEENQKTLRDEAFFGCDKVLELVAPGRRYCYDKIHLIVYPGGGFALEH